MFQISDRMPPQIGRFISDAVYDGLLQSNPNHPVTDASIACHFVNVSEGHEEHLDNQDTSWMVCDPTMWKSAISHIVYDRMLQK